jgi:hypothetical protein
MTTDSAKHKRVQTKFTFRVNGTFDRVAPLFGAHAERAWAGDGWNPQFLFPDPPRDVRGSVFTTEHNNLHATWVNTVFDLKSGHFEYVYFVADTLVTSIHILVSRSGPSQTEVSVAYTRTALRLEGNVEVERLAETDRNAGEEWQRQIEQFLTLP